jgi:hypothetical protein
MEILVKLFNYDARLVNFIRRTEDDGLKIYFHKSNYPIEVSHESVEAVIYNIKSSKLSEALNGYDLDFKYRLVRSDMYDDFVNVWVVDSPYDNDTIWIFYPSEDGYIIYSTKKSLVEVYIREYGE